MVILEFHYELKKVVILPLMPKGKILEFRYKLKSGQITTITRNQNLLNKNTSSGTVPIKRVKNQGIDNNETGTACFSSLVEISGM